MAEALDSIYDICLSALREGDRDRYLCALLTPDHARGAVSALYAFNLEIARVRDNITEPMMGEVRLQWWRDLFDGNAHGEAHANPIAAAVMETVERYDLSPVPFRNMIDARQFDLYDDPMPDRNAFEGYAGETASALIQLGANVLSADGALQTANAAGHAGVAQLAAGTLLLLPVHRARGQVYVPADILAACGLDREAFLGGEKRDAINQAISGFVALGREHLAAARANIETIVPECLPAFLPVAVAGQVFDRAEKLGAGLMDQPLQVPQWRRQWRFWRAANRGSI
ncbi:phytoene/squalene synthase family protein [Hoeflea sp. TYP-13]|uniref:phytoene/squalene synthase family protein n=1 Tax=Hoeflea sp. TYP-13 TaxID=3230023 RepID=UPI0034C6962D